MPPGPGGAHKLTKDLNKNALQGARIGVVASQVPAAGTDNLSLWNAATSVLTQLGATLVPVTLDTSSSIAGGSTVLSYEFKRDLNVYLSRLPGNAPMKTLADIIAYNSAHAQASNRRPFNIAFLGQAWSEPTLIGYAYAYEQATLLRQPPSAINPTLFG